MDHFDTRPEKLAWLAVLVGAVFFCAALGMGAAANINCLTAASIGGALLTVLSLLSAIRLRLVRRQGQEEENLRIYRREHPETELFEDSDEALRLAARANRSYSRYAIPIASVLVGGVAFFVCILLWRQWSEAGMGVSVERPLPYGALSVALFVAGLLSGSFFVGASRDAGYRYLRPSGAWMFFTGALCLLAAVVLFAAYWGSDVPRLDIRVAKVALAVIMVLAAELVVSVVIEFYRPRKAEEEARPIYESRILALFTEPGGIARNVAASLDYQFGFEVSEAWFYRFLERAVIPFGVVMIVAFWLMTCLVVIDAEENGIRERFGRVTSEVPLQPGLYAKLPWPFARIYTFPVERIQQIPVGYTPGSEADADPVDSPDVEIGDLSGRVIVWDKMHNKSEVDFVVASAPEEADESTERLKTGGKVPVSVYFMSAAIPVYFKVHDLYSYAYRHTDARKTLERIAMREVTSYFATVDLFEILVTGRAEGGHILRERIQRAAKDVNLGVDIVFVGLEGIHPPVKVGDAFNDVVGALEKRHAEILTAEQYAINKEPEAEAEAVTRTAEAEGYTYGRLQLAQAEAQRFEKQLTAHRQAPGLFVLRNFLDVLETETQGIRKYIITIRGGREVVILNLEEKLRPDLMDIDLDGGQ